MTISADISPLRADVDLVIQGGQHSRLDRWSCQITAAGKEVQVLKILNIDIQEYFEDHYQTIRTIDVIMGLGQYTNILYPGREDMIVNLVCQDALGGQVSLTGEVQGYVQDGWYTGLLYDQGNEAMEDDFRTMIDTFTLDISKIKLVRIQLFDKTEEQVRLMQVGGVWRQCTVAQVLSTCMTYAMQNVQADERYIPRGLDIAEPDNVAVYDQIIIPHGLKLPDLPGYLQRHYGVYNTGLGHFIRNGVWYVFPMYNLERVQRAQHTMQVSIVSRQHYPALGITYRRLGTNTMIIANGARQLVETSTARLGNEGNGVKFLDANMLAGASVDTQSEPNKALLPASSTMSDYVAFESANGVQNVPVYGTGVTANPMQVMGELAARAGSYLTLEWNFSDPDLVKPGTLALVRYVDQGVVREFEGVLIAAIHSGKLYGEGLMAMDYWNQTALRLFVKRDLDTLDTLSAS